MRVYIPLIFSKPRLSRNETHIMPNFKLSLSSFQFSVKSNLRESNKVNPLSSTEFQKWNLPVGDLDQSI